MTVDLTFEQILETVKRLPSKEKLLINEAFGESGMGMTEEHEVILIDRQQKIKENPERLKDWDEFSTNL
jgi:hypothetical protein